MNDDDVDSEAIVHVTAFVQCHFPVMMRLRIVAVGELFYFWECVIEHTHCFIKNVFNLLNILYQTNHWY